MALAAAWIDDDWIYSREPAQSGRFWIHDGWIWDVAEVGKPVSTGFWISRGWIFGPEGAANVDTGFFIRDAWIYGPSPFLPFAPQPGGGGRRVAGG